MKLVHHLVRRPLGRVRRAWLRRQFAHLGKGSSVGWPIDVLTRPDRITIGDEVFISPHVRLEAPRAVPRAEPGTISTGRPARQIGWVDGRQLTPPARDEGDAG